VWSAALGTAGLLFCAAAASGGTINIHSISLSANTVGLYEPLTVSFALSKSYVNPYDPDQVDVWFEFTGPYGIRRAIPAYWTDDKPAWKARIVPLEVGLHTGRIVVRDSAGDTGSALVRFTAVPSASRGFIRIDPRNSRYLQFDNGEPYRPVGHNLCWYGGDGSFNTWLNRMASAGENWTKYWIVPYVWQDIEWGPGTNSLLGRYSQSNARLLDNMFEAARTRGIYVQACLDSFNGWNQSLYANWDENPYNAARGGMCVRPIDFFTHPEAKRLAKRRLRYIVARLAWNPAILCWELFNEVDAVGSPGATFWGHELEIAAWHQEMAQYIRSIDPFEHLRTTSFADDGPRSSYAYFWELPEMDIIQVHQYASNYPWEHIDLVRQVRGFNKPIILGEADAPDMPDTLDPDGQSLHDIIWAAAVAETGGMSWWWEEWIHPRNLYYRFTPLVAFLEGEDWAPQQLTRGNFTILSGHTPEIFGSAGSRNAYLYIRYLPGQLSGLRIRLNQVRTLGTYSLEWWDTHNSTPFQTTTANGSSSGLVVNVPTFTRDVALKVKHLGPALEATLQKLTHTGCVGHDAPPQSFGIRNSGSGQVNYTITSSEPWCSVSPVSGSVTSETDTITIEFASRDLPAGVHSCTITASDTSGQSPPVTIRITLIVLAAPGDADADGDVDQEDFGRFQVCLTGDGVVQTELDCQWALLDGDTDVDADDLALFVGCMSQPDVLSKPDCLN